MAPDSGPIIVAGYLELDADDRDPFVADAVQFVADARHADGNLDFVLAADPVEATRVYVLERWESRAALDAFRGDGVDDGSAARIRGMHVHDYPVS